MIKHGIPLLLLFCMGSLSLSAQEFRNNTIELAEKPYKVGVVLSGGGAKGYAHVGVLKVLEEAGIRVDFCGRYQHGSYYGWFICCGLVGGRTG